ncbi:MAG: hypothetical protein ABI584_11995 [Acidobacteriota bacterium]
MTGPPTTTGRAISPGDFESEANVGKWNRFYEGRRLPADGMMYGGATTYYMAGAFLVNCREIEDWGCGAGGFRRFCGGTYIGIDGSRTPFAEKVVDLTTYRSAVDGILLRHVLEHNYNWTKILDGAVTSFRRKLCVVLFTPFSDTTRELRHNRDEGLDVPDLSFAAGDIEAHFAGLNWKLFRGIESKSQYGVEHVYCVWRD